MKKNVLILIFAFFCISNILNAQPPNWQWARSGGGTWYEFGVGICTDANRNVYVTGYYDSTMAFGATVLPNAGGSDVFFAKYDPNGNLIWAKHFGGSSDDQGFEIVADINGDIYVTGHFLSPSITIGNRTLNNSGGNDIFLTKFDTDGNLIWAKRIGGIYWDMGNDVTTDASGNVFLAGSFESNFLTFGSITIANTGVENAFIVKYDSSGNEQWAQSYGGTMSDGINAMSIDPNGNALISGYFFSATINFGTTTLYNINPNGHSDLFITKLDPDGNTIWAKSASGDQYDEPNNISTDASGNVLITGFFSSPTLSFGTISIINSGYYDYFIVKYDTSGNVLWAKDAGGIGFDYGSAIDADSYGNIYVGGTTQSSSITFGSFTLTNPGNQPIFLVKYDALGNELWAVNDNAHYCNSLYIDANDDVLITGAFGYQNLVLGNDTLITAGNVDVFLAKIIGTSTDLFEQSFNSGISIAPNPFTDQTTITFKEEQKNTKIKIMDILGNEISSITFSGNQYLIEKGTMKPGVYFIQTIDEKKNSLYEKLVVQ